MWVFLSWLHGCCCHSFPLMGMKVQLNSLASRGRYSHPWLLSSKLPGSEIKIYS